MNITFRVEPIDTAPKDGTEFGAWCESTEFANWFECKWLKGVHWDENHRRWAVWVGKNSVEFVEPTHWAPDGIPGPTEEGKE